MCSTKPSQNFHFQKMLSEFYSLIRISSSLWLLFCFGSAPEDGAHQATLQPLLLKPCLLPFFECIPIIALSAFLLCLSSQLSQRQFLSASLLSGCCCLLLCLVSWQDSSGKLWCRQPLMSWTRPLPWDGGDFSRSSGCCFPGSLSQAVCLQVVHTRVEAAQWTTGSLVVTNSICGINSAPFMWLSLTSLQESGASLWSLFRVLVLSFLFLFSQILVVQGRHVTLLVLPHPNPFTWIVSLLHSHHY